EAAHRLAAHGVRARPRRRLPGARRAGRGRQRFALQRGSGGADLPDTDRRHGRLATGPGTRAGELVHARGRRDRADRAFRTGGGVVSAPPGSIERLAESCSEHGFLRLGEVGGDRLVASGPAATLSLPVVDLATAFETGIPAKFS